MLISDWSSDVCSSDLTTAAGSLGMLAIGAGGIEVALAMAGEPLYISMPRILGVKLEGSLPDWVSAKDVALEMLRSEERRVGKECVSTCRSRWSHTHYKKKQSLQDKPYLIRNNK